MFRRADRERLDRIDRTLDRIDGHMARGNELMEQIREEHRLNREQHRLNLLEHKRNQARFEATRDSLRRLTVETRESREILEDVRHGMQTAVEGLVRILDEMRRDDSPGSSPAGA